MNSDFSWPQPAFMSIPFSIRIVDGTPKLLIIFLNLLIFSDLDLSKFELFVGLTGIKFKWQSSGLRSLPNLFACSSESFWPLNNTYSKNIFLLVLNLDIICF